MLSNLVVERVVHSAAGLRKYLYNRNLTIQAVQPSVSTNWDFGAMPNQAAGLRMQAPCKFWVSSGNKPAPARRTPPKLH
jgi:hypothetical protein